MAALTIVMTSFFSPFPSVALLSDHHSSENQGSDDHSQKLQLVSARDITKRLRAAGGMWLFCVVMTAESFLHQYIHSDSTLKTVSCYIFYLHECYNSCIQL